MKEKLVYLMNLGRNGWWCYQTRSRYRHLEVEKDDKWSVWMTNEKGI